MGMSRKPLSSTNTRWAPRRAAFFYPGPRVPLPPGDGRFVALDGPALGLLAAPAQAGQDFPHVRRMIPNAKLLADQRSHSGQRPEIGAVPGPQRPVAQQRDQLRFLAGRQSRWAAWGGVWGAGPAPPRARTPATSGTPNSPRRRPGAPPQTASARPSPARSPAAAVAPVARVFRLVSCLIRCHPIFENLPLFLQDSIAELENECSRPLDRKAPRETT